MELETSNVKDPIRNIDDDDIEMVNKVNLWSGKVLPPKLTTQEKGN